MKLGDRLAYAYATAEQILAKAGKTKDASKFDEEAKVQWWHPWKVQIEPLKSLDGKDVSIKMPTLFELKPQAFAVSLRDCAP